MAERLDKPVSRHYNLTSLLSSNELTQAWAASRTDDGAACFLKISNDPKDASENWRAGLLREAHSRQGRIRSGLILTATACHREVGRTFLEYPYINELASPGSPERWLAERPVDLMVDVALALDYLHATGLVHCDLKLDNFRPRQRADTSRFVLVDLDTVHEIGTAWKGRTVGTPGLIAPEVLRGGRLSGRTDIYSLGKSIAFHLDRAKAGSGTPDPNMLDRLETLVQSMTRQSPDQRPMSLIDELARSGIITGDRGEELHRTCLSMLLLGRFRLVRHSLATPNADLQSGLFFPVGLYSLPDELATRLAEAGREKPRATLDIFKRFWQRARIERLGDFWRVTSDDSSLLEAFRRLDEIVPHKTNLDDTTLSEFLALKDRLIGVGEGSENLDELRQICDLSLRLNRPGEAADLHRRLLAKMSATDDDYLEVAERLVLQSLASGQVESGIKTAENMIESLAGRSDTASLPFERLRTWNWIVHGETERAIAELKSIVERARQAEDHANVVKATGVLASAYQTASMMPQAEATFEDCLKLARRYGLEKAVAHPLTSYAGLLFNAGEYSRAVSVGKLARDAAFESGRGYLAHYALNYITLSFVRLGDYTKADYWFGVWLQNTHRHGGRLQYQQYYLNLGWMHLVRGRMSRAIESLRIAESLSGGEERSRERLLIEKNLAFAGVMQGRSDELHRHLKRAGELARELDDPASVAEVHMIELVSATVYGDPPAAGVVESNLTDLLSHRAMSYAGLGYLLMVAGRFDDELLQARSRLMKRLAGDLRGEGPIYRAAQTMIEAESGQIDPESWLTSAKQACRQLDSADLKFSAAIMCRRLADQCRLQGRPKLGTRFLQHGATLAESLDNQVLLERWRQAEDERSHLAYEKSVLLKSLEGIARVVSHLGSYREALQNVIQLAVDLTEAERAVILTRESAGGELQVRAFINCDDRSLAEISDFSRSIAETAMDQREVFVTGDALTDRRTQDYKSIFAHNIRSVICVPIVSHQQIDAVIYLDHHTIPALFDAEDVQFVRSLAEFISVILDTAREKIRLDARTSYLEEYLAAEGHPQSFISQDPATRELLDSLIAVAESDANVLIRGESGTGKEILCNMIHARSPRAERQLIKVNCASIPDNLVESELFGTVKGAATGVGDRMGKFEAADGGTLFLDEIGELPLIVQAKVLRAVENQEFERVGSNTTIRTDVRFLYATNRDLKQMVAEGTFREDLYYRVAAVDITVPPLRDRPDDIEPLLSHFARLFARPSLPPLRFSPDAVELVTLYHWPGNVRELRNLVERLSILSISRREIGPKQLPEEIQQLIEPGATSKKAEARLERSRLTAALIRNAWNQSAVSRELNLPLSTLRRKIKKHGITKR